MFVLVDRHVFWWPATAYVPDPVKAGRHIGQTFRLQFEALPLDEARELNRAYLAMDSDEERADHQHDLLPRVIIGWDQVIGDDKEPIEFSTDRLRAAIQHGWFRTAAYRAYTEAMDGQPKSKAARGN